MNIRKELSLILLFCPILFWGQSDGIGSYLKSIPDLKVHGCVKSIFVVRERYQEKAGKTDTIYTIASASKVFYKKDGKMKKRYEYTKPYKKPNKEMEYDSLGRIIKLKTIKKDGSYEVKDLFFSTNSKIPDSINSSGNGEYRTGQQINHFSGQLIEKQEYFREDTLRKYSTYVYDKEDRLTKETNINTKYGAGIIVAIGVSVDKAKKRVYPNDTITYRYKANKDTLITYKSKNGRLREIEKVFSSDVLDVNITEKYSFGYLIRGRYHYKWQDSTKSMYRSYGDDKSVTSETYSKTITINDTIKKQYHKINSQPEKEAILNTHKEYDDHDNWILKELIVDNYVEYKVTRTIEYYCD